MPRSLRNSCCACARRWNGAWLGLGLGLGLAEPKPKPKPKPKLNLKPNLNLIPNPNSNPSPSPNPNQLLRVRTALGRCQQADVAIAEPPAAPNLVPTPSWSRCLAALAAGDEFYRGRGAKGEALLVRVRVRARVRARVRVRVS